MTKRIFAIGDIHGCNRNLERLIDRIDPDPAGDTLVFLGDYIDRGPDSRAVIDTLIDLKRTLAYVVCLKGNHEEMFLNYYLEGRDEALCLANGGAQTFASYGMTIRDAHMGIGFPEEHLRFLNSLSLFYETTDYIFVHAGLRPGVPLDRQSTEDLLWIRDEFVVSDYDFGKTVVFGHTPLREPMIRTNRIGIDTGAVYGGRLTGIELRSRTIIQA